VWAFFFPPPPPPLGDPDPGFWDQKFKLLTLKEKYNIFLKGEAETRTFIFST
jgi:hypothetical protein